MNREPRGFHFLVGIGVLWLLWRLYTSGILHDVGFLMAGEQVVSGPGAIVVAFLIEAVIAVGWVATLALTGLWDAVMGAGQLVKESFGTAQRYLNEATREKRAKNAPAAPVEPASKPAAESEQALSQAEMFKLALKDTRDRQEATDKVLAELADAVKTLKKPPRTSTPKVAK